MAKIGLKVFFNAFFVALACNFSMAVAFAQKQSIVAGIHRKSFIPKAISMPYINPTKDDFEPSIIEVAEPQVIDGLETRSWGINDLAKREDVLKTLLGVSLVSVLFSKRQLLAHFFSHVLLQTYKSALVSNPLRTKVVTGASLAVIGDALAQMKDAKKSYDVRRATSFAAFDACYRMFQHVAIPAITTLGQGNVLNALFSMVPFLGIGSNAMAFCTALERTILYQFVLIPFFYYPVFFTFTGMIQGLTIQETFNRAKKSFFPCWKRNLLFWIPTQLVMFGVVAENWQVPFVCVMGILWSLILSVTAGKAK